MRPHTLALTGPLLMKKFFTSNNNNMFRYFLNIDRTYGGGVFVFDKKTKTRILTWYKEYESERKDLPHYTTLIKKGQIFNTTKI